MLWDNKVGTFNWRCILTFSSHLGKVYTEYTGQYVESRMLKQNLLISYIRDCLQVFGSDTACVK